MMGKGIAVAGYIVLDILKVIDKFPERHGLVNIREISQSLGGAVSNTASDLAALDPDLSVKAVGLVGEDAEGTAILEKLSERPNLDVSRIGRRGRSGFTDVLTEQDGRARTFLVYRGANDLFAPEDVDIQNLDCDLFHIGYILLLDTLDSPDPEYGTKMARLLHDVQAAGIRTSVDVVSEVGDRYYKIVPPSLRYTDYFIVNELEAGKTVHIDLRDEHENLLVERIPQVLRALKGLGVKRWVVIHCPEGGFGIDENDEIVSVPSLELPKGFIQGTVGAGDAFCAGTLLAAYRGEDIARAMEAGNVAAACSLRAPGATEGMTTMEEARALVKDFARRAPIALNE